jgi:alkylhydroperoxidase/carboxymuconolactone decarboxylase family protein YurZ
VKTNNEPKPGTIAYLAEHGGTSGRAFKEFILALNAEDALPPKIRELVFIGVQTALDQQDSLRAHIPRARAAGASTQEIAAAMMVAVANGGVVGALHGLPLLQD